MSTTPVFLKTTSYPEMMWLAIRLVIKNTGALLPVVIAFCLPIDVIYDLALPKFKGLGEILALANAYYLVQYFGFCVLAGEVGSIIQGERASFFRALDRVSGGMTLRLWGTMLAQEWMSFWPLLIPIAMAGLAGLVAGTMGQPFELIGIVIVVCAYLVGIVFVVKRSIDFVFAPWVALFERIFYVSACRRSREIVRGRWWLVCFIEIVQGVVVAVMAICVSEVVPRLLHVPFDFTGGAIGIAVDLLGNILSSYFIAVGIAFNTLLYFRLRRLNNDLTFFTMLQTTVLSPASVVASEPS